MIGLEIISAVLFLVVLVMLVLVTFSWLILDQQIYGWCWNPMKALFFVWVGCLFEFIGLFELIITVHEPEIKLYQFNSLFVIVAYESMCLVAVVWLFFLILMLREVIHLF